MTRQSRTKMLKSGFCRHGNIKRKKHCFKSVLLYTIYYFNHLDVVKLNV